MSTITYAYTFHTTCNTPGSICRFWAFISPHIMRHPKRPGWWENNNEK
ncbi:hypothetical protein [Nostoc sp. UHCC 0251]|nr:hypothetical protein [Nostoc sp. UHCC 0251]MEA5625559.1 hypothetical protein [Nostoc sp. UHCC 0251]